MALHRILLLGAMFFLVALCPNIHLAIAIFAFGIAVYLALWLYEIYKRRNKP